MYIYIYVYNIFIRDDCFEVLIKNILRVISNNRLDKDKFYTICYETSLL